MNSIRTVRDRQAAQHRWLDHLGQLEREQHGTASILAQTTTVSAYPTTASAFFACVPVDAVGVPKEGNPVTYVAHQPAVFYAWNIGTAVPPNGTTIVCHLVGLRWVFGWDG